MARARALAASGSLSALSHKLKIGVTFVMLKPIIRINVTKYCENLDSLWITDHIVHQPVKFGVTVLLVKVMKNINIDIRLECPRALVVSKSVSAFPCILYIWTGLIHCTSNNKN